MKESINAMAAKAFVDPVHFKEEAVTLRSSGPGRGEPMMNFS